MSRLFERTLSSSQRFYHGSDDEFVFRRNGKLLYVTDDKEYVKNYGEFVYEVVLDDARIFEGRDKDDLHRVIDAVQKHARSVLESFYVYASPKQIDESMENYDWKRFADILANRDWQLLSQCKIWAKKPRGGNVDVINKQFMIDKILPSLGYDGFLNFETFESRLTLQDAGYEQSSFSPAYGIINLKKIISCKLIS